MRHERGGDPVVKARNGTIYVMKRALIAAALLLANFSLISTAEAQTAPADFTIRGSGFGHGVGMSQYGAYGQALEGRSAAEILRHYYSGAAVTTTNDAVLIKVNLLSGASAASLRGEVAVHRWRHGHPRRRGSHRPAPRQAGGHHRPVG